MRSPRTFTNLKLVSFTHSCIYTALLVCAFAAGKPQPATFVLGLTHGLLWIAMSLACIVCVRMRILPLRLAAAVAVLGGIGPFFGSYEFIREQRRRTTLAHAQATVVLHRQPIRQHRRSQTTSMSSTRCTCVKQCEEQVNPSARATCRPHAALE